MNIILFDPPEIRRSLLPLTYTRPVCLLRCGIVTIQEKWARHFDASPSCYAESYLQSKYPMQAADDNLLINGGLLPDDGLVSEIRALQPGEGLSMGSELLAARVSKKQLDLLIDSHFTADFLSLSDRETNLIRHPWDIFLRNGAEIRADFKMITAGRTSAGVQDVHSIVYGAENIFIEEGARVKAAILNAEHGPIYLGKNSEVQEGAVIRGPFALCEGATVNMGAKIRGDSTFGPFCKVGGEVANSVFIGYSNKGHDGYMGNSVVGAWCNFGADTNTSNLKNNYMSVKLWNYQTESFQNTGLQFCGLIMGDHSKCGINTMFNTGTVVGVSANIFGSGFPRNFIPSFSWGGTNGFTTYQFDKAVEVAGAVMKRRNENLDENDRKILFRIYEMSKKYRIWEKG